MENFPFQGSDSSQANSPASNRSVQLLPNNSDTGDMDKGDGGSSSGVSGHNSPSLIRNNGGVHGIGSGTRVGSGEISESAASKVPPSLVVNDRVNLAELSRTIISQELTDNFDVRNRLDFGKTRVGGANSSDLNNNDVSENLSSLVINNDIDKKDLEQRDVSLESITTNNGTILNSYLSCSTKPTRQSSSRNILILDDNDHDPLLAPGMDKAANESLLDNLIRNGACDGQQDVDIAPGPEKQLIDPLDHLCFNRTDEEKLLDDQKSPPDNHCKSASSKVSLISGNDDDDDWIGEGKQIQVSDKNPSDVHSNREFASSLIDLKGHELTFSKECVAAVEHVKDENGECQDDTNKTDDDNDNMQEDVGVRTETVNQFHNLEAEENHSDTASAAEIKTRSATATAEDVESHDDQDKTKEDEDKVGAAEKFSMVEEEVAESSRDDKDKVFNVPEDGDKVSDEGQGASNDTPDNVTSLEVEWLQQTLNIPFYKGVVTNQTVMNRNTGKPGKFYQDPNAAENVESSLPIDFGESLPPRLTGLVNKQFRMLRLVKEAGMELGVLITKKFNKDKRTTGYIIAYIEPHGLVHR